MSNHGRPLSPHLSIYRWPITMTLSILHRASGIGLSLGFVVLAVWLFDAAADQASYETLVSLLQTTLGRLALIGWSYAFFFHFSNGVRHFFWDVGKGFEIRQANASAWFVLLTSIALTAAFWWLLS
jgi:succinate dehydrogenase / fumarate reductase cytochrome b subunit